LPLEPEVLRSVALFASLTPATLSDVAAQSSRRRYRPSMLIVAAGEPNEAVHFLLSGRARVFRSAPAGQEQVLETVAAGELLPVAGFAEGQSYPASVESVAECSVGVIRNADLVRLIRVHPDLAWAMVVHMSQRLRWAQGLIYDFSLRGVSARIAGTLLDLSRQQGAPSADGRFQVSALPRHREIGQMAGCTRETVTRTLLAMQHDGTLREDADGRMVLDVRRLAHWREPDDGAAEAEWPAARRAPAVPVRRITHRDAPDHSLAGAVAP